MLIAGATMIPWLITLLILAVVMLVFPYLKILEFRKNNPSEPNPRFNIGDEVTYKEISYEIAHIDADYNYNILNTEKLSLKKVPVPELDSNGILTKDLNKMKQKYGEKDG